jgi:hypothetical protein
MRQIAAGSATYPQPLPVIALCRADRLGFSGLSTPQSGGAPVPEQELGGPYLQMAAFCENVIEDKNGVLSLIRIIDRTIMTATGVEAPEKMPPFPLNLTMVLGFKSGFAQGTFQVRIRPVTPDGQPRPELTVPIHLEGADRGHNLILPIRMMVEQDGLYWFDVYVGDTRFTRMPFRIVYQRVSIQP